jgi:predicted HAD superfamily Cof-like phosphohydrolase
MKTDFKTWKRETLEEFARQAADENKALHQLIQALHDAWKKEVAKNAEIKPFSNSDTVKTTP